MTPTQGMEQRFEAHRVPPGLKNEARVNGAGGWTRRGAFSSWLLKTGVSYLCRLTLSVLLCCCDTMAGTGCGADGSRRGRVTTCCRCSSRGTGCCRAGGERVSRSGDNAAGSGRWPSTGSSAVSATVAQTP